MSSTDLPFGTNNPFRRKQTAADPSLSPAPAISSSGFDAPSPRFDGPFDGPFESTSRPPFTTFKTGEPEELEMRDEQPVQIKPKKIVKKVRVQSPPPSSPEDVAPVRSYPPDDYSDSSSSSDNDSRDDEDTVDPFDSGSSAPAPIGGTLDEPSLPRPPPNPFSKTLRDLEQSSQTQEGSSAATGKGSLDVDSFKRLLLTGYANLPGPPGGQGGTAAVTPSQIQTPIQDGASNTDASSVSRQSIFDAIQETPRTSHEISEPEESEERRSILPSSPLSTIQTASGRKPPPPPSSRHGKLIKMELGTDSRSRTASKESALRISIDAASSEKYPGRKSSVHSLNQPASPPSASDINKPLPLPPFHTVGDIDSPFDQEAAGKVPETFVALTTNPRAPTPPLGSTARPRSESQTSTKTTSSAHRKPAAPPPRRHGQGRIDSKPPSIVTNPADEEAPRSSLESNRSRAGSLRVNISSDKNLAAPAPPPPRRPNHARQGSSFTSPTAASFTSMSSPGESDGIRSPSGVGFSSAEPHNLGLLPTVTTSKDGLPKLSPPPPPPARHTSTRRPASIKSVEIGTVTPGRKPSREKEGGIAPPPPPPPRSRGGSRGNKDTLNVGAFTEKGRTSSGVEKVEEEPVAAIETPEVREADDIMKQIEALQREVEAARKVSGGPG